MAEFAITGKMTRGKAPQTTDTKWYPVYNKIGSCPVTKQKKLGTHQPTLFGRLSVCNCGWKHERNSNATASDTTTNTSASSVPTTTTTTTTTTIILQHQLLLPPFLNWLTLTYHSIYH